MVRAMQQHHLGYLGALDSPARSIIVKAFIHIAFVIFRSRHAIALSQGYRQQFWLQFTSALVMSFVRLHSVDVVAQVVLAQACRFLFGLNLALLDAALAI